MPRTDTLDYYVSIIRDGRKGLLTGPFATHTEAIANVPAARDEAYSVDPWSHFDLFGTCSLPRDPSNPMVTLNQRLGVLCRPPY